MSVQFSVLGPVRAWRGPVELNVGPNQQRAILALLLVRANQLVPVDDMMELLWDENPPASAVNVVHKYIGSIRHLLEPGLEARASGRWLTRHGVAYRLASDENISDLLAFRQKVKEARSAGAASRPADALDLLLDALALRRGACGEGLDLYGRNRHYFAIVDQEYVAAVADAADVALDSGQPLRILALLRQVAVGELLNESLQARLMLMLAAAGQQAMALAHYQAVRERLRDDLGVDPGGEMRAAYSRVLRQELPAAAAEKQAGAMFRSGSAGAAGGQAVVSYSPPGVLAPLVPPAQLPADLPTFAGRESELSRLAAMLSPDGGCPTVAICAIDGMAGIGKTTFAIHGAHDIAKHFEDGQLYIDLRGFDSSGSAVAPLDALHALLYSLGVPASYVPDGLDARAGLYRSVLAGKRVLIVLDNARDVQQVRPLLPGSPGCLVIVTSRNPLAGLIMTDGARLLTLNLPSLTTSRQTLERRLGADRVAAQPEAVAEIIRLCGRLPLALAIVCARAANPAFTLASIAADLRRTQGRLEAFGAAGVASDARTVFSWSYRHLGPQARRLFRLLSLHPAADITLAASASLLGVPPDEAKRLIAELANTALLTEHQPWRYSFHELIRAYAAELLADADTDTDRHEALGRMLNHYLHSSHAAQVELKPDDEPITPSPPPPGVTPERFADYDSAMSWFGAERRVLNASVLLAAGTDFGFPAWQLALNLRQFYQYCGLFRDWIHVMEIALRAAVRDSDLPGQGHVLRSLAAANYYLNRDGKTVRCLQRAQAIYTKLGCTTEHAYLHSTYSAVFTRQGKLPLAIEHSKRALELYRAVGYRRGEVRAIADIGIACSALGEYQKATSHLEHAIVLAQEIGAPRQEGGARKSLGIVRSKLGRHDDAVADLTRALIILRRIGHRPQEAETLLALGDTLAAQGQHDAAYEAWQQASVIFSTFNLPDGESLPQGQEITERLLTYTPAADLPLQASNGCTRCSTASRRARASDAVGRRLPQLHQAVHPGCHSA